MNNLLRTKIADKLSGKNILMYYKLYSETQWYCENEMLEYRLKKLKLLLNHCYQNVPFYKKTIEDLKIDINNLESLDILKEFPIISKQTILDNYNDFIPKNLTDLPRVKTGKTGGTTGRFLVKRTDSNLRSSIWGAYRRFYDWMDVNDADYKMNFMGGHIKEPSVIEKLKKSFNDKLFNDFTFDPYDTSDTNLEKIRQTFHKYPIRLIRGYSQHLYTLAKYFEEKNEAFNVRSIMTTAEPLMLEHRRLLKKIFNADVYDQYGCGEIGAIAFECSKHNGLHITEERVIAETDSDNNLILTDLDNFSMPYIRYKNDDQAIISEESCSCGRKSKIIKQVMGRSCDYITGINGKNLHWGCFWHLMYDSEIANKRNIIKFQFHQVDPETIRVRTVGNQLLDEDKETIRKYMIERLGSMKIVFLNEVEIENAKSGKYRPVINDTI